MQDKLRESWSSDSYGRHAQNYLSIAGHLVERTAVDSTDDVLDVGCGTGSVAISATRQGASVTGVDISGSMLEQARANTDIAGVTGADYQRGDATDLPFDEDTFDIVLSSLGHIYGDPPSETAEELLRVTRPGGHIGFTCWIPTGAYPFIAGVVATYLPPDAMPEFTESPFMWGDSDVVEDRLGDHVESLAFETETAYYPALSPEHFWSELSASSGPFAEALDVVEESDRPTLREEVVETVEPYFNDRRNAVELEYLLTTAKR